MIQGVLKKGHGALAHVMLPDRAPQKTNPSEKTKYAADATDELIIQLTQAGTNISDLIVCLVGAGNVLKKQDDKICKNNIASITKLLKEKNIPVQAAILGGTQRKSVILDIDNACVCYTEGEGKEKLLWQGPKLRSTELS